jgi:thiamine-phosphate pyrophosphorylase
MSLLPSRRPLTCLVTDRRRWAQDAGLDDQGARSAVLDLVLRRVAVAAQCGIDLVQLREPDLDARALLALAYACVETSRGTDTLVVVNERADVALAAGAHGVHLRAVSLPTAAVRRLAGREFLVGRSIHGLAEVPAAGEPGPDYLVAGTVFPSRSKAGGQPLLGPAGLRGIVRAASVPVLAIGGVTLANAREVAAVGAAGVAAIDLFAGATDSCGRCESVLRALAAAFAEGTTRR